MRSISLLLTGTTHKDFVGWCPHCNGELQHWGLYVRAPLRGGYYYEVGNAVAR